MVSQPAYCLYRLGINWVKWNGPIIKGLPGGRRPGIPTAHELGFLNVLERSFERVGVKEYKEIVRSVVSAEIKKKTGEK